MTAKKTDHFIKNDLYNIIAKNLSGSYTKTYKSCIERFIKDRYDVLYDQCPCDRIYFRDTDALDLYKSIGIDEPTIMRSVRQTYYFPKANFNPRAAKDPATIALMCVVKYYHDKKDQAMLKLSALHLAFSGKFYPSIHSHIFKYPPAHNIMEYVVNNELSEKYDLKRTGSVADAIMSINETWTGKYTSEFSDFADEDVVYIIQQVHTRIKSFLKNIASVFYDTHSNGSYMNYDQDDLSQDNYHLTSSDSRAAEAAAMKASQAIVGHGANFLICQMCASTIIKTEEVKSIIDTILTETPAKEMNEFIHILIFSYMASDSKDKSVVSPGFIAYSITLKPNTKDEALLRGRAIVEHWLDEKSALYRKRKSRPATKIEYHKMIYKYFAVAIVMANK